MEELSALRGLPVRSSDGDKIGSVEEVFYDEQTQQPEWIGIGTGFFGNKRVLVPMQGASFDDSGVTVPYSKEQVKDAPDVDSDEIGQELEQELYSYYGLGYSERRSDTGLPEGGPSSAVDDEGSLTRSEEELRVGKREYEAGRVRLRKWVETEQARTSVPVSREEVRIEREPISGANVDRAMSGPEISEAEHEVVLHEEQAVAAKQTVPKERVRLEKDVVTEEEEVGAELRKERLGVEGDPA